MLSTGCSLSLLIITGTIPPLILIATHLVQSPQITGNREPADIIPQGLMVSMWQKKIKNPKFPKFQSNEHIFLFHTLPSSFPNKSDKIVLKRKKAQVQFCFFLKNVCEYKMGRGGIISKRKINSQSLGHFMQF